MNRQVDTEKAVAPFQSGETQAGELSLSDIFEFLDRSKWLIGSTMLVFAVIGFINAQTAPPVYQATALLQVEERQNKLDTLRLANLLEDEPPITDEIQIIKSRMVLSEVAEDLKLDLSASPKYQPLFGARIAQFNHDGERVSLPWKFLKKHGWDHFAWGGEQIKVDTFTVPDDYRGEEFTLVAGEEGKYTLFDPDDKYLGEGIVGNSLDSRIPDAKDDELKLFVSQLKARPGTHFTVTRKKVLAATNWLNKVLVVVQPGRNSQLLAMSVEGKRPHRIAKLVNHVADVYVRQHVERMSEHAQTSLAFIEEQLPAITDQLNEAKAELNNYQLTKGSIDLPLETQILLNQIVTVESNISERARQRKELLLRFTPSHPRVKALDGQIASFQMELAKLDNQVQVMPETQQDIVALNRKVEVSTNLYTRLLNKQQEYKVVKAGTVGNVRIVDYALPPLSPVRPNRQILFVMYVSLGFLLGVGIAFFRTVYNRGVDDPGIVEEKLGIPVYGAIPHSPLQRKYRTERTKQSFLLGIAYPDDLAVESIRSLRTSLHFALHESKGNKVLITSPIPGIGKTFLTVNLGVILAQAGKRVLLVDADLRKGRLHSYFGEPRGIGLSTVITIGLSDLVTEEANIKHAIRATQVAELDIVTTGPLPKNPSELLMHEGFSLFLSRVSSIYDYVIIDSPPVLAVTDAAVIGHLTDTTLMVVKSGRHPLRELERTVRKLQQAEVKVRGIVFNDINLKSGYREGKFYGYASAYKYGG